MILLGYTHHKMRGFKNLQTNIKRTE